VSGNYKTCFKKHAHDIGNIALERMFEIKNGYATKSPGRINVNDGKPGGHIVYILKDDFFEKFTSNYK
jgi:hypothetical protein